MPTHGRPATSRCRRRRKLAFGLQARPTTKEMGPLADGWRPWRAVAARLLWTYYRAVKSREGVLDPAAAAAAESLRRRQRDETMQAR